MRSPFHGSLGTLLMLAPLAIVPVLAMYGLPESRQIDASQAPESLEVSLGVPAMGSIEDAEFGAPPSLSSPDFPVENTLGSAIPADQSLGNPGQSLTPPSAAGPSDFGHQMSATPGVQTGTSPFDQQQARVDQQHAQAGTAPNALYGNSQPSGSLPNGNGLEGFEEEMLIDISEMNTPPSVTPPQSPSRPMPGSVPDQSSDPFETNGFGDAGQRYPDNPEDMRPSHNRSIAPLNPPNSRNGSSTLTWNSAVKRMGELGIRSYQLEPGAHPGEFHFSCIYTAPGNARITHRFEAEAAEPLEAVKKVIEQVEKWTAAR